MSWMLYFRHKLLSSSHQGWSFHWSNFVFHFLLKFLIFNLSCYQRVLNYTNFYEVLSLLIFKICLNLILKREEKFLFLLWFTFINLVFKISCFFIESLNISSNFFFQFINCELSILLFFKWILIFLELKRRPVRPFSNSFQCSESF